MNNIALITGASSGIGLELAKIHASEKGDLILVARSTNKLLELKKELEEKEGVQVLVLPKDLSIPDSAAEIYEEVTEKNLHVEYLINNAGFGDYGLFHETEWDKEEMMINVNILSLTHLTKLFGQEMINRRSGRIMNLSSLAAFQPGPMMNVYYATKHYVQAFTEALYEEWKEYGVTVTALCPGPTTSGFQKAAAMGNSRMVKDRKLPSSKEVAEYGYKAMMTGKMIAVPGTVNSIFVKTSKFIPKKLMLKAIRKMKEKRK